MHKLRELCNAHTSLSEPDIAQLESIAVNLPIIAELVKADVFIDCITRDRNAAIVVAEAKPPGHPSMYKHSVVGELALRENEPAALRTLEIGMPTRDLKAITQENMTVKQNVVAIKNKQEKTIAVLIMEEDVTERVIQNKQMEVLAETAEQLSETLLTFMEDERTITNYVNDAIVIFDRYGRATYSNPVAYELYKKLGYKDHIIGMHFNNLVLDGTIFKNNILEQDYHMKDVDIGDLSLQVKYAVMKHKKILSGMIMLIKDITDVKEKEKELILKSVAIREIHHRVKNNLQTIASLLRLQSRRIDNETVKKYFQESINRILSIAITHEILAQKGVDNVDIKTIISRIKESALDYELILNKNITLNIIGDNLIIDSDKATSIALVVNELLQNCFQYAFKEKSVGSIEVWIQKGSMYSSIFIIDNGGGFRYQ